MPKEPVIISGLGAVSAAGSSVAETLASFREGRRSGGPVTLFESPLGYPAFEVRSLPCIVRARRSAHGRTHACRRRRSSARCRSSEGPVLLSRRRLPRHDRGQPAERPRFLSVLPRRYGSRSAGAGGPLSQGQPCRVYRTDLRDDGPVPDIVNACSSGTDAIGVALSWLRAGLCDIVIAGGADELSRIPLLRLRFPRHREQGTVRSL